MSDSPTHLEHSVHDRSGERDEIETLLDYAVNCPIAECESVVRTVRERAHSVGAHSESILGAANVIECRTLAAAEQHEKVLALVPETLTLLAEAPDRRWEIRMRNFAGNAQSHFGNFSDALEQHESAFKLADQIGERGLAARCLTNVGNVFTNRGEFERAIDWYERARAISAELDDSYHVTLQDHNLAELYRSLGDLDRAHELYTAVVDVSREHGFNDREALASNGLSALHAARGDFASALSLLQRSLELFEAIGNRSGVAMCLSNLGVLSAAVQNHETSLQYAQRACAIYRETGNQLLLARSLSNLASALVSTGQFVAGHESFTEMLDIAKAIGATPLLAQAYDGLGRSSFKQAQFADALAHHLSALEIFERLDQRSGVASSCLAVGRSLRELGESARANDALQRALSIASELDLKPVLAKAHDEIARICEAAGNPADALVHLREHIRIRDEMMSNETKRQIEGIEATRKLELAHRDAEIERLRNVELAEALRELEEAHRDLKSTQSQLIHAEKMASLGQLTAGIAHEINNPINFIRASASPLRRDVAEIRAALEHILQSLPDELRERAQATLSEREIDELNDEVDRLLHGIEDGETRTADIVKGLRTFSRLDEDELKLVDLHEGIDSTISLLRSKIGDRITVDRDYGDLPAVECYPGQINQVFMNLLTNAIDSIDEVGRVTVKTMRDGGAEVVSVSVSDTGCGIDEAIRDRIFEPFFTTKPVGSGQGLGLAIAHGIVSKHGGTLTLESEVGAGTTATLRLPLRMEARSSTSD